MKPHEQWWDTDGIEIYETGENFEGRTDSLFFTCERLNNEDTPEARQEQARLAACAPEMARMLLDYESRIDEGGVERCLRCNEAPLGYAAHITHTSDCAWLALMRKAGVRD